MAIKPFNSVGGISVGSNLELSISANNNATFRDLSANGTVLLNSSGNVQLGSVANVHIDGGSNGQYLATDGSGGLSWVTLDTDTLANGTSNVSIDTVNGPITMGVNGTANVVVVGDTQVDFLPDVYMSNDLTVSGNANISGTTTLGSTLDVTGAANLASTLSVTGAANLQSTLDVGGAANVSGALTVSNSANVTGSLAVGVDANVAGNAAVGGTLGVTGATTLSSTLAVVQGANLQSTLAVADTANFAGQVNISNSANITGSLSVSQDANIGNALTAAGAANLQSTLVVGGAANLNSTLGVSGAASLDSTLSVTGAANLASTLAVSGAANLASTLAVSGAANLDSTLGVLGAANLASTLGVAGATEISNTLTVTQGANLQSTLVVGGAANLNSSLGVSGATEISNTLVVTQGANLQSTLAVGGAANLASTLGVAGAVSLDSTLGVLGAANLSSTLSVAGDITGNSNISVTGSANIGQNLAVTGDANVSGNLAVTGDASWTNGNAATLTLTTSLTTANLSANGNVTLGDVANVHIAGGTSGQVLKTDGAGNLSWETNAILINGTSNVSIPDPNGNVTVSSNGQANIISVYSNGTHATTTLVDDVVVTGNLTVQGNVTNIDTTNLNVEDPIITEGRGANNAPLTTDDGLDRGLYSWYWDTAAAAEKGGFVGYKNAGAFAGHYIMAKDATLTNNTVAVNIYADVVLKSLVSGPAGNVAGLPVSSIDMGTGTSISIKADSHADLVVIADAAVDIDTNLNVDGDFAANGNIQTDGHVTLGGTLGEIWASSAYTSNNTQTLAIMPDAPGLAVEFFVTSKDATNSDFETAKYLAVSDGNGTVDFTTYGTVRIGNSTGTVNVTESSGNILLQVNSTGQSYWTVQYHKVNI